MPARRATTMDQTRIYYRMKQKQVLTAYAFLLMMPLFYSTNLIIGRVAVAEVAPYTLAFFRWLVAFAILVPFALAAGREKLEALWAQRRTLSLLAFLGMIVCGAGVYVSLQWTSATNATLIYTAAPALIILIEWLLHGRPVSLGQIVGMVAAIAGIVWIVVKGDIDRLLGFQFNLGDIGIAMAAISWAFYSVILRRDALAALPVLVSFAGIAGFAVALLFPLFVVEAVWTGQFPSSRTAWISIVALAVFPSVLAFSAFQYGVKAVGPSVAGLFVYLMPVFGVVLAALFLDERFEAFHAVGMGLVMAGVVMATLPTPRKRTKAPV